MVMARNKERIPADIERKMDRVRSRSRSPDLDRAASAEQTLPLYKGGAQLVRRISASINNARARQTRESESPDNFYLHRSFFLIIWEHFAPNSNIKERPRQYNTISLNVRLPPIYRDGNRVCSLLLRCVRRGNNIAYSVLFEFIFSEKSSLS